MKIQCAVVRVNVSFTCSHSQSQENPIKGCPFRTTFHSGHKTTKKAMKCLWIEGDGRKRRGWEEDGRRIMGMGQQHHWDHSNIVQDSIEACTLLLMISSPAIVLHHCECECDKGYTTIQVFEVYSNTHTHTHTAIFI